MTNKVLTSEQAVKMPYPYYEMEITIPKDFVKMDQFHTENVNASKNRRFWL